MARLASGEIPARLCGIATVLFLALRMGRPLYLEGEAGVGKTEVGKVLARTLSRALIRLQCYEGLDESKALFEWNYKKQLLRIQAERNKVQRPAAGIGLAARRRRDRHAVPRRDALTPRSERSAA